MTRVFAVFFLSIAGAMACFQALTPGLLIVGMLQAAAASPGIPPAAAVELHEYPGKPKWNELVRFHRRLVAEKATMTPEQIGAALREEERLMKEAKAETKGLR